MSKVLGKAPSDVVSEIAEAMPTWMEKLNLVVGMAAITFSVIALNSNYTEAVAWCFLGVILLVARAIEHYFPPHIKELRKKRQKSDLESIILKGVEAHYLGFRSTFSSLPLYWVGVGFLFAVASGAKGLFLQKILPLLG